MAIFGYLIVLLQQYLVPFIFAVGLIFFIYGIVHYFIIGPGEEPTREQGRIDFLKALVWFCAGLALYGVVALLTSFFLWTASLDVDTTNDRTLLPVPDAPRVNN